MNKHPTFPKDIFDLYISNSPVQGKVDGIARGRIMGVQSRVR